MKPGSWGSNLDSVPSKPGKHRPTSFSAPGFPRVRWGRQRHGLRAAVDEDKARAREGVGESARADVASRAFATLLVTGPNALPSGPRRSTGLPFRTIRRRKPSPPRGDSRARGPLAGEMHWRPVRQPKRSLAAGEPCDTGERSRGGSTRPGCKTSALRPRSTNTRGPQVHPTDRVGADPSSGHWNVRAWKTTCGPVIGRSAPKTPS